MSSLLSSDHHSMIDTIKQAILMHIPEAIVEVSGEEGHYSIFVISPLFKDKSTLERQRMVYQAITPWMKGESPLIHAIDSLQTQVPPSST
ncbi:BolA/IbaG family iron-sulfur metabolism protein [Pajaroellobacter abortibovis]|uniref:BolA family transcriptional regulator n=1 Tax=Pajaroellobacter abortibovis TaxID=1882918 RepID=A0A1L6MZ28_9BACT|nr:BolA family protein [Pajaroellobacter abortibovis]APS00750.1 hypothetical protein BCY86_08715 [Pajaroellobacter abortibovis]